MSHRPAHNSEAGEVDCPICMLDDEVGYVDFSIRHYLGDSETGQPPETETDIGPCSYCGFDEWEDEGWTLVKKYGFWLLKKQ